MTFEDRYRRSKEHLLSDDSICAVNRRLFTEFFDFEEYKLQRRNGLRRLDEACYKTLCAYLVRLRNVNLWFKNKPWTQLTKIDIKRVYDALEDGRITTQAGRPFKDRRSYYNKIFKSKPFRLAGKADTARQVIEFYSDHQEKVVRFLDEENFLKIVSVVSNPEHLLLLWLAWDIGENINTLLQLRKQHLVRQIQRDTSEVEYLVSFPKDILKRSRTVRSEPTLYPETARYASLVLDRLGDDGLVFPFGYRYAVKVLKSALRRSGAVCNPNGDEVSWKDLRSGMACHLLREGWTTDEVNFRLGHKPSSREIDVYVSHLAIDRHKPKCKLYDNSLQKVQNELEEAKKRERLLSDRIRRQGEENDIMRAELAHTRDDLSAIRGKIEHIFQSLGKDRESARSG